MTKDSKYEKYYNLIINEILSARMHFRLLKSLQEAKKDYLKELNQAPGFFNFTIKAHLDTGLMHVFKVLKEQKSQKKREKPITIWKFLDFVESNLELFSTEAFSQRKAGSVSYNSQVRDHRSLTPKDIENDKIKLNAYKQVIINLMTWRDKKYAHMDERFALRDVDVFKDFPVKFSELEDMTMTIADILNNYSRAYDASTYIVDMAGPDGVNVVLDSIRLDLKERQKQLEKWRKRSAG